MTLALTVGSALAAELLGTVKSVDADAKKITVTPKDGGDDVVVTIKDDTEYAIRQGQDGKNYDPRQAQEGLRARDHPRERRRLEGRHQEGGRQEEGHELSRAVPRNPSPDPGLTARPGDPCRIRPLQFGAHLIQSG